MRKLAALLLAALLLLAGCQAPPAASPEPSQADAEPMTLRVMAMGNEPDYAVEEFYAQLDALTVPELGCVVRFSYIPWGDEKTTINNAIAAGEYDIYCNGVFTDYRSLAERNAFIDLNGYLDLTPQLVAHYQALSPDALAQCEINGGLYGFPQAEAVTTSRDGIFLYRDDLLAEWGLPPVTSFETMEDYLYAAKADPRFQAYPMIVDNRIWQCLWEMLSGREYMEITTMEDMRYAVVALDDPYRVVCRMETETFRTILAYVKQWYQDGIIDEKILGLTDNEGVQALAMLMAGQKPCETNSTVNAVGVHYMPYLLEAHPEWSWSLFYNSQDALVYRKSMADATCISVSSRCQYPETAVRFIEKAHTDQRYYDLLVYGVEGMQYHLVDGRVSYEGISAAQQRVRWTGLVDSLMERPVSTEDSPWLQTLEAYEQQIRWLEDVAGDSPLIGLNLSMGGYDTSGLDAAWDLYMKPLLCGITDDLEADYAAAMEALYAAGLQDYLDQVQRQLTEYQRACESADEEEI